MQSSADEGRSSVAGDLPSGDVDRPSEDDAPGLGSALRKALLALGVFALAYLVARRMRPADPRATAPAIETASKRFHRLL